METFLLRAAQMILSLSLLVIVHEFGHFIFARLFKVRVEKFYLFFNPWFSLFKFKPRNSETEYGIGWLPLGGYVKIAGMIDESMDKEQMKQPAQPWEFRSKPAGQRLLIMVGGVLFNFLLALFIYSMILYHWGDTYLPMQSAKAGLAFSETAKQAGFEDGDILLATDGVPVSEFTGEAVRAVTQAQEVTVLRNGEEATIAIPPRFMERILEDEARFAAYINPVVVSQVVEGGNAREAGLQAGDSIVALDGLPLRDVEELLARLPEKRNDTVSLSLYRNGALLHETVAVDSLGKIGIGLKSIAEIYPLVHVQYGFWESFPKGIAKGIQKLTGYASDMKYVFTKAGAKSLGGFGTLGSIFPPYWDWQLFWEVTALLSIMLAVMNILPIPALDGGHVLFLLYEVITRRKPNEKFMEYAQMAGMLLLFALLIFANGNDLFRFLFK